MCPEKVLSGLLELKKLLDYLSSSPAGLKLLKEMHSSDEPIRMPERGKRINSQESNNTLATLSKTRPVLRHRTVPVKSSITHIPAFPLKLSIFQTHASPCWHVKCFFSGKTVIRSLKTSSKSDAVRLAKGFYETRMLADKEKPELIPLPALQSRSVIAVTKVMLQSEKARADRGEIAAHAYTMTACRVRKHILPFFKDCPISRVNFEQAEQFLNYLSAQGYKSTTLSLYMLTLRKVLTTAQAYQWISQVPQLPKVKVVTSSRGGFSVQEYLMLLRTAWRISRIIDLEKQATHRSTQGGIYTKTLGVPHEMAWLIGFMVNSFVRPADIKIIQHKHVQVIRGEYTYLRLSLPETKKHKGQIITLPAAVRIYESLTAYFGKRGLAQPEDYLFMPQIKDREAAIVLLEGHFRKILIDSNLRYSHLGQRRTLYSLRHSAITFRLLYGKNIDLLTLARNARTSAEMIDKFYASELTAEMNVDMLHSRR
jgi:hypothetical protein